MRQVMPHVPCVPALLGGFRMVWLFSGTWDAQFVNLASLAGKAGAFHGHRIEHVGTAWVKSGRVRFSRHGHEVVAGPGEFVVGGTAEWPRGELIRYEAIEDSEWLCLRAPLEHGVVTQHKIIDGPATVALAPDLMHLVVAAGGESLFTDEAGMAAVGGMGWHAQWRAG